MMNTKSKEKTSSPYFGSLDLPMFTLKLICTCHRRCRSATIYPKVRGLTTTWGNGLGEPNSAPNDGEELELFDNSIVSLLNGKFQQAVLNIPDELKHLPEDELHSRVNPTANDWKLRQNFTNAVYDARKLNKDAITTTSIYEGIVSKPSFFEHFLPNPLKVAWIVRPVVEHTAYYNAIHREGLNKLFRMVKSLPEESKYIPLLAKLVETAGNRVHGPVVQRMQIHSKNLNVEMDAKQLPQAEGQEDLSKKIEAMQAKLLEGPKDVTPAKED
jgi:hypothetical protein